MVRKYEKGAKSAQFRDVRKTYFKMETCGADPNPNPDPDPDPMDPTPTTRCNKTAVQSCVCIVEAIHSIVGMAS